MESGKKERKKAEGNFFVKLCELFKNLKNMGKPKTISRKAKKLAKQKGSYIVILSIKIIYSLVNILSETLSKYSEFTYNIQ